MKALLICFLLLTALAPAKSQDASAKGGTDLMANWGMVFGGAGHNIKNHMIAAGFDEKMPRSGFYQLSDPKNPKRTEASAQISISVPVLAGYRVKGLFHTRETIVHATDQNFDVLQFNGTCNTMALLGLKSIKLNHTGIELRIGAGPAFTIDNSRINYGERDLHQKKSYKPGLALESGFRFFTGKRFFLDTQVHYFYAGKTDLGSHILHNNNQPAAVPKAQRVVDLSRTSLSSLQLGLGLGYRFGKLKTNQ